MLTHSRAALHQGTVAYSRLLKFLAGGDRGARFRTDVIVVVLGESVGEINRPRRSVTSRIAAEPDSRTEWI